MLLIHGASQQGKTFQVCLAAQEKKNNCELIWGEMYEAGVQADLSERSQGGHAPSASVGRGMGGESIAGLGITDLVSTPALHLPF